MLLLVVAIVALTAFFAVKYFNFVSYWRRKGIKYEPAKTLLGNIHNNVMQKESMADILQGMYKKFPDEPYFGITTFMRPTLVVKDPALIKELAVKNLDTFMVHKLFNSGDKSHVFSKNLFAASGEIWRSTRPALSPAFSGSKIKAMYNLVNNCSYQWFRSFEKNNDKLMTIDLKHDILTRFTIDVISTCIFGLESNSFANKTNEFYERALDAGDFGGKKIFALFGYCLPEFLVKMFNLRVVSQNNQDFFATVVKETIRIRKENNITRPDVINLLMEGRKGNLKHDADNSLGDTGFATVEESFMGKGNVEMSDEEIVGHSLLFLIAGSDTTACGLTFLFYELALNKDVQDRLAEEIREFMVEHNGKIPYEELPKMKYMDMVCSESLRKWPPLPVTDRCTVRPYTIETGDNKPLHLETGSVVWFPMFAIHRDPKYFENPEKFDPERFSDENRAKINKDAYLPFGIGPKACIGSRLAMLMFKSIVVHVLYNFEIVPVEKTPIPLELSKKHIFLNSESTVWLGLQRRA